MRLRCFIVDDEPGARLALRDLITRYDSASEVVGEASDIPGARQQLAVLKPHLVFLDLEMTGSSGFEILRESGKPPYEIVITSAFSDRALEAFRHGVADYLVKPVDSVTLNRAFTRVRRILKPIENSVLISVPTSEGDKLLQTHEISRFMADRNYTWIFGSFGKPVCVSRNLGHFEELTRDAGFVRIHHSHLVSLFQIIRVNLKEGIVEMQDGELIPVSREKRKNLYEILEKRRKPGDEPIILAG